MPRRPQRRLGSRNPAQWRQAAAGMGKRPMQGKRQRPSKPSPELMQAAREITQARRQRNPKMAGLRPVHQRSGWAAIPIIGPLIALLGRIVYPRDSLKVQKRSSMTGAKALGSTIMARVELRRNASELSRAQRAQIAKERSPKLTAAKARQHARGRMPGVVKYPQRKAA